MPLSKLSSNSMYTSLVRNMPKATATKLPGSGNVPGMGAVGPSGTTSKLFDSTGTAPPVPTFSAAQGGQKADISNGSSASGVAPAAHNDPRDPTYWTDVAKINNTFNTNESSYALQQQQGQTLLNDTLAKYDKQQPVDIGNARGSYNDAGLFYSTRLGGKEGDINSAYETNRTNARSGFAGLVSQLGILRNQNQNEYGKDAAGNLTGSAYLEALNAGIGRASAADAAAAQANQLAAIAAAANQPPPAPAAPVAPIPPVVAAMTTAAKKAAAKRTGNSWGGYANSGIGYR